MIVNFKLVLFFGLAVFVLSASAIAQNTFGTPVNTQIQLPVVSFFNVQTVVSVPDAGVMSLGGVSRHASGRSSRGIPGFGRGFANRSAGYFSTASNAGVKVRVISPKEMGDAILSASPRRSSVYTSNDPNGSKAVQAKADFISQHVGRSKR